ncbi:hypothetical protein Cni_G22390 [Canna indica]|uniref:Uncharacterized protein n=1 Tax=Canna indica TaxID=4628 RepID=A0AAQ3QJJ0_9LILI|nr:hypothetical protein Cni_G22390 [Canna indica]
MYPSLLTCNPSPTTIPFLDIRKVVTCYPLLVGSSIPDQLLPALRFLYRLGFVGRRHITYHTTVLLISSVETTLLPKLEYLYGLGFSH